MNHKQAQAIVREASPGFLASNPPTGILEVMADIKRRLTPHEFRKPFVRLPDDCDDEPDCAACLGQGDCYISEEQESVGCPYCGGEGSVPFNYNQVFIFVYRNFHSIEALVSVSVNGDCHAVVTVAEQGFRAGQEILLNEEEKDLARCAVKEAGELPPNTTE